MKKLLWLLVLLAMGCEPASDPHPPVEQSSILHISHRANGQTLSLQPFVYQTAANQDFSISKVHYVLSKLKWTHQNGKVYEMNGPWFIDALANSDVYLPIPKLEAGQYQFECTVGLDSSLNTSYYWDNLAGFVGMAWPQPMGGGYHFLKLEGQYRLSNQQTAGFAFHLGKSNNAIRHQTILMEYQQGDTLSLQMQLERWFGPPVVWDFTQFPSHTMTNDSAMQLLVQNGKRVFLP